MKQPKVAKPFEIPGTTTKLGYTEMEPVGDISWGYKFVIVVDPDTYSRWQSRSREEGRDAAERYFREQLKGYGEEHKVWDITSKRNRSFTIRFASKSTAAAFKLTL